MTSGVASLCAGSIALILDGVCTYDQFDEGTAAIWMANPRH